LVVEIYKNNSTRRMGVTAKRRTSSATFCNTMKHLSIPIFILLGVSLFSIWLLFPDQETDEDITPRVTPGQASPDLANESPSQFGVTSAIPPDQLREQQNTRLQGTSAEILRDVPQALKPRAVIAFDETDYRPNGRIRRAIVSTDSALGTILIVQEPDGDGSGCRIYSAEHLVVSLGQNTNEKEITAFVTESGFRITKPFPDADFLFVHLEVETPSALFSAFDSLLAKLNGLATVELDGAGSGGGAPSDPSYSLQWHHQTIDSELSWDITQGNDSIIVAVLDTGVNISLSEFSGRIVSGYDFVNNDSNPLDDHGHGTAVAGVVAANANNGVLVAGVDWQCKLMPVKVLDSSNWGYYSWWAAGVNYAKNNGARVINLSAGGSGSSSALTSAINNAISEGVVFVTITQNDGVGSVSYPGSLPQVITVGATERNDAKASFSNWGPQIDIVAPGRDIYTVNQYGNLDWWWGTSFAAPQVAGAAALLLSLNPELGQDSIAAYLVAGAEDGVGDSRDVVGFDNYYGWGRLNIYNSIVLARTVTNIEVLPSKSVRLRWQTSPNAVTKKPYKIRWSENLVNWHTIESHSISFSSEAEWIDDGSETGIAPVEADRRFYMLQIGMD
jgi:subtilisin family serine protease